MAEPRRSPSTNALTEDDNNPRDQNIEEKFVEQGESIGAVQEMEAIDDKLGKVTGDELHREFGTDEPTSMVKSDVTSGRTMDNETWHTELVGLNPLQSHSPAPIPSTLDILSTSYPGSPNDSSIKSKSATTHGITTPEQSGKQGETVKAETASTPTRSLSPAPLDSVDLDSSSEESVGGSPFQKPGTMVDTTWLQQPELDVDYNGEWSDTPSRVQTAPYNNATEPEAEESTTPVLDYQQSPTPVPVRARTTSGANPSDEELIDGMEKIDLDEPFSDKPFDTFSTEKSNAVKPGSPPKTVPSFIVTEPSTLESAKNISTTGAISSDSENDHVQEYEDTFGPQTPKTLNIQAPVNEKDSAVSKFGLNSMPSTPAVVSPMPTFTPIRAQAESNLRRRANTDAFRRRNSKLSEVDLNHKGRTGANDPDSDVSEEFENISVDVLDHGMGHIHEGKKKSKIPSYRYPGTYEAAKHDTVEAAKNVGAAAKTFGSAIFTAGIGKAAWSVGALSVDSARRATKHLTTQAILQSGYKESLPAGVKTWTDANEEKRQRKAEAKKREYKLADQSQPRYKTGKPLEFVKTKAESTKAVATEPPKEHVSNKKEVLLGDEGEEQWALIDQKEVAESNKFASSRDQGEGNPDDLPYPSSFYEISMGLIETGATTTVNLSGHVSAAIGGMRNRFGGGQMASNSPGGGNDSEEYTV
ncbi:hypothetical protein BU23DRAFT_651409 [Bimuria novae-zelandiae CBS 107.79]|uniref:Uncharacterized protein n=1 Tax=Bimuria novae-zelandiae CBS 107.79 TaxID=1447943 RepID=A0A6A5VLD5_9PLEO|nr:hypothetical protein BU23DRAFT_651409 [Bimuria novae-zelandiae CBS 107.79]